MTNSSNVHEYSISDLDWQIYRVISNDEYQTIILNATSNRRNHTLFRPGGYLSFQVCTPMSSLICCWRVNVSHLCHIWFCDDYVSTIPLLVYGFIGMFSLLPFYDRFGMTQRMDVLTHDLTWNTHLTPLWSQYQCLIWPQNIQDHGELSPF